MVDVRADSVLEELLCEAVAPIFICIPARSSEHGIRYNIKKEGSMFMLTNNLPQSAHFQLQEVTKGVYAAIVPNDGLAIGNAGIIDLGDQTIIFDTFEDPLCANDLRLAAERVTGRPATYIINSHMHADHWYGNQVFAPSTPILATPTTIAGMAEFVEEVVAAKPAPFTSWSPGGLPSEGNVQMMFKQLGGKVD
ncbi:MAG: MBL fold metallo-hydrolase [Chloroflexi bacterium]|nr:MBL fold metallo-hydrolase [Chloroflexota bacterium]